MPWTWAWAWTWLRAPAATLILSRGCPRGRYDAGLRLEPLSVDTTAAVASWYDSGLRLASGADAQFAEACVAAALTGAGKFMGPDEALTYLSGAGARNELLAAGVPLDVIRAAQSVVASAASSAPAAKVWPMLGGTNKAKPPKVGGTPACVFA